MKHTFLLATLAVILFAVHTTITSSLYLKSFYFVRHGQTEWNVEGRCQGQRDTPLNNTGIKQAENLISIINTLPISMVFYSPLQRASLTAHIACQNLICPKIPLDTLKERYYGSSEGTTASERFAQHIVYNGESTESHAARVIEGVNFALSQTGTSLIIAHDETYKVLMCHLNIPYKKIDNCTLVLFTPPSDDLNRWTITEIPTIRRHDEITNAPECK